MQSNETKENKGGTRGYYYNIFIVQSAAVFKWFNITGTIHVNTDAKLNQNGTFSSWADLIEFICWLNAFVLERKEMEWYHFLWRNDMDIELEVEIPLISASPFLIMSHSLDELFLMCFKESARKTKQMLVHTPCLCSTWVTQASMRLWWIQNLDSK